MAWSWKFMDKIHSIGNWKPTHHYKWMAICRLAILQNDSMAKKRLLPWESLGGKLGNTDLL